MKHRNVLIGITVLFVLSLASAALAQGARHGPHHGPGRAGRGPGMMAGPDGGHQRAFWQDPEAVEALGLTDEQIRALEEQSFKQREEGLALRSELDKAQLELDRAMSQGDEPAALRAAKKVGDLQSDMFVLRTRHRIAQESLLTAEQQTKLSALRPGRQHKGQGRGRGRTGRGQRR